MKHRSSFLAAALLSMLAVLVLARRQRAQQEPDLYDPTSAERRLLSLPGERHLTPPIVLCTDTIHVTVDCITVVSTLSGFSTPRRTAVDVYGNRTLAADGRRQGSQPRTRWRFCPFPIRLRPESHGLPTARLTTLTANSLSTEEHPARPDIQGTRSLAPGRGNWGICRQLQPDRQPPNYQRRSPATSTASSRRTLVRRHAGGRPAASGLPRRS